MVEMRGAVELAKSATSVFQFCSMLLGHYTVVDVGLWNTNELNMRDMPKKTVGMCCDVARHEHRVLYEQPR